MQRIESLIALLALAATLGVTATPAHADADNPPGAPTVRIDPAMEALVIGTLSNVLRGLMGNPAVVLDTAKIEGRLREFLESSAPAIMLNRLLAETLADVPPEIREPLSQWLRDLLERARNELLRGLDPRAARMRI